MVPGNGMHGVRCWFPEAENSRTPRSCLPVRFRLGLGAGQPATREASTGSAARAFFTRLVLSMLTRYAFSANPSSRARAKRKGEPGSQGKSLARRAAVKRPVEVRRSCCRGGTSWGGTVPGSEHLGEQPVQARDQAAPEGLQRGPEFVPKNVIGDNDGLSATRFSTARTDCQNG